MDIFLIFLLIFINGLFAMTEMSVLSAKRVRLQQMVNNGSAGAMHAINLQERPEHFISTVQVGITSIGILNGFVGEKAFIEPILSFINFINVFGFSPETVKAIATVSVIVLLTYLSVILGEIIPKRLGLMLPERVASVLAMPMYILAKFTYPIVFIFTISSKGILKLFKLDNIQQASVTNEEIKDLMDQGTDAGVFHEREKELVSNVLHMDEKRIGSIMTHRSDFFYINIQDEFQYNLEQILDTKFSRVLLVNGDIIDNIIGVLHVKDIVKVLSLKSEFKFEDFAKKPIYISEYNTVTQALEQFISNKTEMSIVVNEYGENVGLVTLVDITETIVGDIPANDTKNNDEDIVQNNDTYLINGSTDIDKFCDTFNIKYEHLGLSNTVNTVSGFVMEIAGCIPNTGYKNILDLPLFSIEIMVVDMDKNFVDKVSVKKINPPE